MHLSWLDPHKMRRMTVVGTQKMAVFDDMELDRKITVYDSAAEQSLRGYGEWVTRSGDIYSPRISNDEPLRLECRHFLSLVQGEGDPLEEARDGVAVVRALEALQQSVTRDAVCQPGRVAAPRVSSYAAGQNVGGRLRGHGARGRRIGRGSRSRRQATDPRPALDREAGSAPAARHRIRVGDPRGGGRLRRLTPGRRRHRGRSGMRA